MKPIFTFLLLFLLSNSIAQSLNINFLSRYIDGQDGACEISDYDENTQTLFITNAASNTIDLIDISDISNPVKTSFIDISPYGGGVNSLVNLENGYFAAAIEANVKQDSGVVVFFTTSGVYINQLTVGALPDMISYSKLQNKVLVACEGEPNDDYTIDPNGSICIIDISAGVELVNQNNLTCLTFANAPAHIPGGLLKPGNTWAEDLEPEYIAINNQENEALVVCQENNVFIKVDIVNDSIIAYKGLGFKDHSIPTNALDVSDKDDTILIRNWNINGVYQPDAIASYTINGDVYWLSANEGDARDYDGYSSETRVKDVVLDNTAYPNASTLQENEELGRLKTFTSDMLGDTDGDGDIDQIYSYGARSFSIWHNDGTLAWDSGNDFEQYIATHHADWFNCNNGERDDFDKRSDDKGPEPEAITIGKVYNTHYAFIGLERQGGIMVYNIENPNAPVFETYLHTFDNTTGIMTDIAPEGLKFIPKDKNPTEDHLLVVSNEVSGTTTIYAIEDTTQTVSALSQNAANVALSIYPNPATDILYIKDNENKAHTYEITNVIGQKKSGQLNNDKAISLHYFKEGVYYISLYTESSKRLNTHVFIKK